MNNDEKFSWAKIRIKILPIYDCFQCYYHEEYDKDILEKHECSAKMMTIESFPKIPIWCPLEDKGYKNE